jgi:hypothetical protein
MNKEKRTFGSSDSNRSVGSEMTRLQPVALVAGMEVVVTV